MTTASRLPRGAGSVLGACTLFGMVTAASNAQAYRTAADLPEFAGTARVRWELPVIGFVLHPDLPPELVGTDLQTALHQAFLSWSAPSCSGITFLDLGTAPADAAPEDGLNTVQWLSSGWRDLGAPADAAALTDVQYELGPNGKWVIVEADLYLNAEDHLWSLDGRSKTQDVSAVITHEAGHMLGLLHPCELDAEDGAPDCYDLPEAAETTMFPRYSAEQQTLAADDEAGVCFLYPRQDPEPQAMTEARRLLGASCQEADECAERQCLAGFTEEPVCTHLCNPTQSSSCPSAWSCISVEDRHVCAPQPDLIPTGGAGCQLSQSPSDLRATALCVLCVALAAAFRRARREFVSER